MYPYHCMPDIRDNVCWSHCQVSQSFRWSNKQMHSFPLLPRLYFTHHTYIFYYLYSDWRLMIWLPEHFLMATKTLKTVKFRFKSPSCEYRGSNLLFDLLKAVFSKRSIISWPRPLFLSEDWYPSQIMCVSLPSTTFRSLMQGTPAQLLISTINYNTRLWRKSRFGCSKNRCIEPWIGFLEQVIELLSDS